MDLFSYSRFFRGRLVDWVEVLTRVYKNTALHNIITIAGMAASFYFLALALKSLPLGNEYAIWTDIGTVGTVVLGIVLFKEPINVMRAVCIAFIVLGIVGLKLISIK